MPGQIIKLIILDTAEDVINEIVKDKSEVGYILLNYSLLFETQKILKGEMKMLELTLCHLYPELLNLYGDTGNIISLVKRCQWRNINVKVKKYNLGDKVDFGDVDIFLLVVVRIVSRLLQVMI